MASAAMVFGSDFNQSGTANWATRDIREFLGRGRVDGRGIGFGSLIRKACALGFRAHWIFVRIGHNRD